MRMVRTARLRLHLVNERHTARTLPLRRLRLSSKSHSSNLNRHTSLSTNNISRKRNRRSNNNHRTPQRRLTLGTIPMRTHLLRQPQRSKLSGLATRRHLNVGMDGTRTGTQLLRRRRLLRDPLLARVRHRGYPRNLRRQVVRVVDDVPHLRQISQWQLELLRNSLPSNRQALQALRVQIGFNSRP